MRECRSSLYNGGFVLICLLTENQALKSYLESLLDEAGVAVCPNKADADLLVVDLDTVNRPETEKRVLTLSCDPFILCDLFRPFSQEKFLLLVKDACEGGVLSEAKAAPAPPKRPSLSYEDGVFYLNGERVTLTPAEHSLLYLLYQNRGKAVPLSACADALGHEVGKGNMPSVYINHLRRKIDYLLQKRMIVTLRNEGYMLVPET